MNTENLDKWFRFIGYGDPNSWLWFIGIEEGGERISDAPSEGHAQFVIDQECVNYDPNLPPARDNQVWSTALELARYANLRDEPAQYFISNIAPLPRQNVRKNHDGVNAKEFRSRVIHERVGRLLGHHKKNAANAMLFHGKEGWRTYKVIEQFGLVLKDGFDPDTRLVVFDRQKLIFAPTFSWGARHFNEEQREAVKHYLKKWRP